MTTAVWPYEYLRPAKITRHIAPRTTAGTVSASGFTQRVTAAAHAWVIVYADMVMRDSTDLRYWDSMAAFLDGGSVAVMVPLLGEDNGGTSAGSVAESADAGATVIVVSRTEAAVEPGYHFQIGERLYRVAYVGDQLGDDYTISIRPPLRNAINEGDPVIFDKPAGKMRLATDDEMRMEFGPDRHGVGKVEFREDPNE